jgi:hypothetical protein
MNALKPIAAFTPAAEITREQRIGMFIHRVL